MTNVNNVEHVDIPVTSFSNKENVPLITKNHSGYIWSRYFDNSNYLREKECPLLLFILVVGVGHGENGVHLET